MSSKSISHAKIKQDAGKTKYKIKFSLFYPNNITTNHEIHIIAT